jgi:C4-dicarboxylate-specific signal transduction histidine kinase
MATLNVTSSRDDLVCPLESGSESSGLTSAELTGLVIPIVAVALLIILGTYCYYKRKIRRTKQKAKDMMEAQEVRHDQETRMEQLELPSTHSQLVFDLPVSDSLGDNDAENERLRKQNEALAKELKKHKQVEERLRYRQSGAVDDGDLPGRKVETDEVLFDEMETI